jgi:hypothetical protein
MVSIRISILTFLQISFVYLETIKHDFQVSQNHGIDLEVNKICLISSFNKMVDLLCLASCNFNQACLTVVFDQSKGINENCFLYNRYFQPNELIASSTSTVYEKNLGDYLKKINSLKFNWKGY